MKLPELPPLGYSGVFIIRTYEIDNQKRATIPAIVKLMHEAAMQNVIHLKLSVWDLESHQISWVLMRKWLEIYRMPKLGEQITIHTYPAGFERMFTFRDYKMYDEDGLLIAASSSTWLLMDTQSRKMTGMPPFILEVQDQVPADYDYLPHPGNKLRVSDQLALSKDFVVGWHDLDFNQHLNNTYYTQWMLEVLGPDVLQEKQLQRLDIQYRAEGMLGDKVEAQAGKEKEGQFAHRLLEKTTGKEMALARSFWK
jgi:medium-chain acyl-[acyl-carrier-protein] hydrolase